MLRASKITSRRTKHKADEVKMQKEKKCLPSFGDFNKNVDNHFDWRPEGLKLFFSLRYYRKLK